VQDYLKLKENTRQIFAGYFLLEIFVAPSLTSLEWNGQAAANINSTIQQ